MIWDVLKKEIRVNISSPKLVITYIVCFILILTALFAGAMNYISLKEEAVVQAAAEKDRLRNIFNFQLDFMMQGIHLYRQPDVLSVLVSGVEGDAALRGQVNSFTGDNYDVSKFNSTPILAIFGLLDIGFIVKIILSLFAILFTFDAISGEKELGTLKLNFANSMKRSSFIIGKLIGNFVLLILPFLLPFLLGLLLIQFIPGIEFSGEEWIRISLITLAIILYLLVFYSLGMMVSSLTKRSSVSFLILLMLWVMFIGVIPRAAVLVAQTVNPVPALEEVRKEYFSEFGSAQKAFMDELRKEIVELFDLIREVQRTRDMSRVGEIQEKQQGLQATVQEEYENFTTKMQERGKEIARRQELLQERQNLLAINLSRLTSPTAALTFATDRLARTGVYSSDKQFKKNVKKFVKVFVRNNPQVLQGQGIGSGGSDQSEIYPDVTYFKKESLGTSVAATLQDFAAMAVLSLIFLAVAFVAFLRYDVR